MKVPECYVTFCDSSGKFFNFLRFGTFYFFMTAHIRRTARKQFHQDSEQLLKQFLKHIIRDSIRYMEYTPRKNTIIRNDVILALKRNNIHIPFHNKKTK